jgi:hypothetical protein
LEIILPLHPVSEARINRAALPVRPAGTGPTPRSRPIPLREKSSLPGAGLVSRSVRMPGSDILFYPIYLNCFDCANRIFYPRFRIGGARIRPFRLVPVSCATGA